MNFGDGAPLPVDGSRESVVSGVQDAVADGVGPLAVLDVRAVELAGVPESRESEATFWRRARCEGVPSRRLLILLALALAAPATASAAAPSVRPTPGRIVVATGDATVRTDVDAGAAPAAVALPDGRTLLLGERTAMNGPTPLVALDADGTPARAFGAAGVRFLALPDRDVLQLARSLDGALYVVSKAAPDAKDPYGSPVLRVTRLRPDGTIDETYGQRGTATSLIGAACVGCTLALVQPDGGIVLTGQTGRNVPPPAASGRRWSLTRLTPAGVTDQSFGDRGVAVLAPGTPASGASVAAGPAGTIVTTAETAGDEKSGNSTRVLLTRLTATGAPDPAFAAGTPITTPLVFGFGSVTTPDGAVVLGGQKGQDPEPDRLVRYTPAGAPDTGYGAAGSVVIGPSRDSEVLLADGDRGVLVARTLPGATLRVPYEFTRVGPEGVLTQRRVAPLVFGGGGSSFLLTQRPRPLPPLQQNSLSLGTVVRRADGRFLIAGGLHVSRPTGEGAGYSIGRIGVAALTADLSPDASFGGALQPMAVTARVPAQRAASVRTRRAVLVGLTPSAVGLARVRVTGAGRVLAQSVVPLFGTGRRTVPASVTAAGSRYLRTHRGVRVQVTVTAIDVLGTVGTARASGILR